MTAGLKPLIGELPHEHELEARYCEGGVCDYPPKTQPEGRQRRIVRCGTPKTTSQGGAPERPGEAHSDNI